MIFFGVQTLTWLTRDIWTKPATTTLQKEKGVNNRHKRV